MSALDRGGRIADRAVIEAMAWTPGTRLRVDASRTHLTLRAAIDGTSAVSEHRYLWLPAPARHRLGLRPGDRVLLAAHPQRQTLVVYPPAALDELLAHSCAVGLRRRCVETACRRGGALALRPIELDPTSAWSRSREKGDTTRSRPVSPTLMSHLLAHATERGAATPGGPVLRYRSGQRITRRRYDCIWTRLGQQLPWVVAQSVSTHWLRHATLTWVERNFGYAVARAYAGHNGSGSSAGTTTTYVRADVEEIAGALTALTGEPHPLAPPVRTDEPGHRDD